MRTTTLKQALTDIAVLCAWIILRPMLRKIRVMPLHLY